MAVFTGKCRRGRQQWEFVDMLVVAGQHLCSGKPVADIGQARTWVRAIASVSSSIYGLRQIYEMSCCLKERNLTSKRLVGTHRQWQKIKTSRRSVGTSCQWRKSVCNEKWALSQAVSRTGELSYLCNMFQEATSETVSVCLWVTFCLSLICESLIRISTQFELSAGAKRDVGKRPSESWKCILSQRS